MAASREKELVKNTLIITVGRICTQFISFLLLPLYTSILSTNEYGIVDLFTTYSSLMMPIILLQVDQAVFRFLIDVRSDEKGRKVVISNAVLFAIFQASLISAIFSICQIFLDNEYKWFFLCNILTSVCSNMMLQTARGLGNNTVYALGSFISASSQILINVLLLVVIPCGVYGMLTAQVVGSLFAAAFIFIRLKLYRYIDFKLFDKNKIKEILKYSIPLVPNSLCWWVLNASDRTIVMLFLGTAANGLLSVGHKFSSMFITIYNIYNLSWTESAALHMNDSDRDKYYSEIITASMKFFMCIGIGIIACMPIVFPVLINEKFSEAYNLIPIYMLASMLNVVVGLYSVMYIALKKTKEVAKTSAYAGIINIVVHLALIKFVGLYAACISSVAAFGVMAVYRYVDLKKYMNVRMDLKFVAAMLGLYLVVCISYYWGALPIQIIVLIIVAIISYVLNQKLLWGILRGTVEKLKRS